MRLTAMISGSIAALVTMAGPGLADSLDGGTIAFAYAQFPDGPYAGQFLASGSLEGLDSFPEEGEGGCVAFLTEHEGHHLLLVLGGHGNANGTADAALLYVRSDSPINPGVYPVDTKGLTVMFGFADDNAELAIPEEPCSVDWTTYYDALIASYRFASLSGSIVIETLGPDGVSGTFAGFMSDPSSGTVVMVPDGTYEVGLTTVSFDAGTWGGIKAAHRKR